ncbi:MAG TPA: Nramp family divalent metal transporter [Bacilli bacterium]|nr:Nramp family divalent metal transporter [Bacilli bacterium]
MPPNMESTAKGVTGRKERDSESPATPPKRKGLLAFLGPGFLITLGFIDPGNWATNLAGGSLFGYSLLWVITLSTLMLILLQNMSAKLGIVTGRSLADNVRQHFPRPVAWLLGVTIIIACIFTTIAEYLGAALGLLILFGWPIWVGALLTFLFVLVGTWFPQYRKLEFLLIGFLSIIGVIYVIELFIVKPDWSLAMPALVVPHLDHTSIYVAMGMLGAVIMPHNIYLHSNVVQSRHQIHYDRQEQRRMIRYQMIDTVLAMGTGWLVNSAMIIVAAAVFFKVGLEVTSIEQAAETLRPLAGHLASVLFGVALLCSGLGSSMTSSMAQANVVTGYLGKPSDTKTNWWRYALILTTVPALAVILMGFDSFQLLVASQVALSIQLPFTIIPLLLLVRKHKVMGDFRSKPLEFWLAVLIAVVIILLNLLLLYQTFGGEFAW